MQALLLAAGLGTRLLPLTRYFPKCLTPIQGRPLLGIWLEALVEAGFTKILINVHYMPECVRSFVEQTPYVDYVTWLDEPVLLGTAGTLIHCRSLFDNGPLLLVHADNFSQFSVKKMWQAHCQASARFDITMMTFTTDDPESCGIVELNNDGSLAAFYEKVSNPPSHCANAAVYIMSDKIVKRLSATTTDFSTQVIAENIHNIGTWHNALGHRDIGTIASLLAAPNEIVQKLTSPVTEYWANIWRENHWKQFYALANDLALSLNMPIKYEAVIKKIASTVAHVCKRADVDDVSKVDNISKADSFAKVDKLSTSNNVANAGSVSKTNNVVSVNQVVDAKNELVDLNKLDSSSDGIHLGVTNKAVSESVLVVMEHFSENFWQQCLATVDCKKSVLLIGAANPETVEKVIGTSGMRYLLLVAC